MKDIETWQSFAKKDQSAPPPELTFNENGFPFSWVPPCGLSSQLGTWKLTSTLSSEEGNQDYFNVVGKNDENYFTIILIDLSRA